MQKIAMNPLTTINASIREGCLGEVETESIFPSKSTVANGIEKIPQRKPRKFRRPKYHDNSITLEDTAQVVPTTELRVGDLILSQERLSFDQPSLNWVEIAEIQCSLGCCDLHLIDRSRRANRYYVAPDSLWIKEVD